MVIKLFHIQTIVLASLKITDDQLMTGLMTFNILIQRQLYHYCHRIIIKQVKNPSSLNNIFPYVLPKNNHFRNYSYTHTFHTKRN